MKIKYNKILYYILKFVRNVKNNNEYDIIYVYNVFNVNVVNIYYDINCNKILPQVMQTINLNDEYTEQAMTDDEYSLLLKKLFNSNIEHSYINNIDIEKINGYVIVFNDNKLLRLDNNLYPSECFATTYINHTYGENIRNKVIVMSFIKYQEMFNNFLNK